MPLDSWQCPACEYRTTLPPHPTWRGLLTPCTAPMPLVLDQCAHLPRWHAWPADQLLPALRHRDASEVIALAEGSCYTPIRRLLSRGNTSP